MKEPTETIEIDYRALLKKVIKLDIEGGMLPYVNLHERERFGITDAEYHVLCKFHEEARNDI